MGITAWVHACVCSSCLAARLGNPTEGASDAVGSLSRRTISLNAAPMASVKGLPTATSRPSALVVLGPTSARGGDPRQPYET